MTRRELNLAIFEGWAERVLWQPRLETWYWYHRQAGTLPERFRDVDYLDFYDRLGCSVRYAASAGIEMYYEPADVEIAQEDPDPSTHVDIVRIPEGELRTVHQISRADPFWENRRIVQFPVQTVQDLKILTALMERIRYRVQLEKFQAAAARVEHRAEPTVFLNSAGFTDLIKWHAGLVGTYYLLADHRSEVEAYLNACDERDMRQIQAALELPCRIFNLGDHATNEFTPPPILKRYCIPRWQRISQILSQHGRYVHTHWDGHSRLLLPYLRESGLHGVEALTPEPMGDMTLEMIKGAVGNDIVVLDLIPAIFFLREWPLEPVLRFVEQVVEMFAPRLVLGVSDEISQAGQIQKIEAISEFIDRRWGLAD